MRVLMLGIDPSMSNFGFALVEVDTVSGTMVALKELRLTSTAPSKQKGVSKAFDDYRRARELYTSLQEMLSKADVVAVELPIGSQSASAMKSVGICHGLIASIDKPLIKLSPSEVKLGSVGIKNASKAEMIEWAHGQFPEGDWLKTKRGGKMVLTNANEHLADALAVVETAIKTKSFLQLLDAKAN